MTKIVWALDPFSKLDDTNNAVAATIKAFAKNTGAQIVPVNVMSPTTLNWTGDFSGEWSNRFLPLTEEAMKTALTKFDLPNLQEPKVLMNEEGSTGGDVTSLLEFAQAEGADLIAVATHGRKGVSRFFLGSFAESLLLHSHVPLLTVNGEVSRVETIKKVLIPTDFSGASKELVKKAAPTLKAFGAEVVFYHKIPDLLDPIVQSGVLMAGGGWVSMNEFFEHRFDKADQEMTAMMDFAKGLGLEAKSEVVDGQEDVVDSLNAYIDKNAVSLVVMGAKSSRAGAVVYGSVSRGMIRSAHVPVWSLHI